MTDIEQLRMPPEIPVEYEDAEMQSQWEEVYKGTTSYRMQLLIHELKMVFVYPFYPLVKKILTVID